MERLEQHRVLVERGGVEPERGRSRKVLKRPVRFPEPSHDGRRPRGRIHVHRRVARELTEQLPRSLLLPEMYGIGRSGRGAPFRTPRAQAPIRSEAGRAPPTPVRAASPLEAAACGSSPYTPEGRWARPASTALRHRWRGPEGRRGGTGTRSNGRHARSGAWSQARSSDLSRPRVSGRGRCGGSRPGSARNRLRGRSPWRGPEPLRRERTKPNPDPIPSPPPTAGPLPAWPTRARSRAPGAPPPRDAGWPRSSYPDRTSDTRPSREDTARTPEAPA
jgi:hypothetical protein